VAGKRQHYLPRLLQRGFLDDASNPKERTWLNRKSVPARLVGIRDVGVEEFFYSRPASNGQQTLDDFITELEGDLSAVIAGYRTAVHGDVVDARIAARTIVHLVTRTAHIRSVVTDAMSQLLDEAEALFTDSARLSATLGLNAATLGTTVIETIQEAALGLVPRGLPQAFSERLLAFIMREKGGELLAQASGPIRQAFGTFAADLATKVRDAHATMLASEPDSHGWIEALATFEWRVEHKAGLILSDAVGLAAEANGKLVPLLFSSSDKAISVLLPVASDRLLIGVRPGTNPPSLSDFNSQAAACSENFFIAAEPLDGLTGLIGTRTASEIEAAITNAVAGAGGAAEVSDTRPRMADFTPTEASFSYSVRLADFGDDALSSTLAELLHGLVGALARRLPLQDLDGFTFAVDYPAALIALDRGEGLAPIESTALSYGTGAAMPVRVVRAGEDKTHIVMQADVAMRWMSEDHEDRAGALNTLIKMLALVAHDRIYRNQLTTSAEPDTMTREFHAAVALAPRSYFSARESAFIAPEIAKDHALLLLGSLEHARDEMEAARQRYADIQDIASLAGTAITYASAILAHAADWLGHRDGLAEGEIVEGDDLMVQLQGMDFADWIELFGRDLRSVYETVDGRLDIERALTLSRHVERLLWTFGVLPWPEDDTIRWGVAPPGTMPTDRG
jgi:hypothetical protein